MQITVSVFRKPKLSNRLVIGGIVAAGAVAGGSDIACAAENGIAASADRIINLMINIADPITRMVIIYAGLKYILQQRGEALQMAKSAAYGYVLIQLSPVFMDVLRQARTTA